MTRATEFLDENGKDRTRLFFTGPDRGEVEPCAFAGYACGGLAETRTTKEEKDTCRDIYASWHTEDSHDPVLQVLKSVRNSN